MPLIDKIKSWFNSSGKPITAGYNPGPSALVYANWHRRPPWSYFYADIMLLDPQVWFGLNIGNGPLLSAKVKVKCSSPEIKKFVEDQWKRIWSTSAPQILRAKHYGFLAYEVICKVCDGRIEFDRLRDFHPLDVGQLKSKGARVGIRIRNIQIGGNGYVDLHGPKGLWMTYGDEFSRTWGRAILERCYQPWFDKNSDGGAMDLRRLRNFKDAWIGDQIRYPLKQVRIPSTGQLVSGRDLAREIGENRASGAPVFLPSTRDQNGNYEWDYTPPQGVAGDTKIPEWIVDLDWDILDGLLVPREVVEASTTGSGFSGRSVPLVGFLAVRDIEFAHDVRQIQEQLLKPLALVNFGAGADDFDLEPVPLLETTGDLMGGMGQPDMQNGDGGGKREGQPGGNGNGAPAGQPPGNGQGGNAGGAPQQFATEGDQPRDADGKFSASVEKRSFTIFQHPEDGYLDLRRLKLFHDEGQLHLIETYKDEFHSTPVPHEQAGFDALHKRIAELKKAGWRHREGPSGGPMQFSIADPPERDRATSRAAKTKEKLSGAATPLAIAIRDRLDTLLKKN